MDKYKKHPAGKADVFCPVGYTIDNIIGKKWAIYIIREIFLAPKNFNQILRALNWGLTPKVLDLRLKELQKEGIVCKAGGILKFSKTKYSLTQKGKGFVESFKAIESWSKEWNVKVAD